MAEATPEAGAKDSDRTSAGPRGTGTPGYLPIAEHGLIGDLRSAALVGTNGTIDWYCSPRFDAPSVFASILDAEQGSASNSPTFPHPHQTVLLADTNVLITRFFADDGVGEIQDFAAVVDDSREADRHRLIRRVVCVRGALPFRARVAPLRVRHRTHTVHAGAGQAVFASASLHLALTSTAPIEIDGPDVWALFKLHEGETAVFTIDQIGGDVAPRFCAVAEAEREFDATVRYWRHWLSQSRYRGRWREMVHRSALTLKLLTSPPAPSSPRRPPPARTDRRRTQLGLPLRVDPRRRVLRVRDAQTRLHRRSRSLPWASSPSTSSAPPTARPDPPAPCRSCTASTDAVTCPNANCPPSRATAAQPVRVGNAAVDQLQLDIYGALIDSLYLYDKWGKPISSAHWDGVSKLVDWVCDHWDQPDEGVSETRGGRKTFLYSRLMCWVAIERAMRLAHRGLPADMVRWGAVRDTIRRIMSHGWSAERHAFTQYEDSDILDASLLMMPLAKFIAPTDPKWLATLDALGEDLHVPTPGLPLDQASPDGLQGEEGTFSICSFWYVEALTRAGRLDEARLAFEKMLTYANHLGLYAEEIGVTGEQRGKLPQAFTHLALISAAFNLDRMLARLDHG